MPPVPSDEQSDRSSSFIKDRRFKLSRACDRCRRRRIKCDEGHPCQACMSSTSECTFEEQGKRTHPHKSKRTTTLEDRMRHLETLIQAIPPTVFAAVGLSTAGIIPEVTSNSSTSTIPPLPNVLPMGIPPPSLTSYPLINPSTAFASHTENQPRQNAFNRPSADSTFDRTSSEDSMLAEETAHMSLSPSYLYFDDHGFTRWQGETSGLPVLDLLVNRQTASTRDKEDGSPDIRASPESEDWFPDRTPRRPEVNPETMWKLITSVIGAELMDSLVKCFLSTSYYLMPFLHVPTFLEDYGSPDKWREPGFASFIVAICCLSSRHIDDPRVRSDPEEGVSAGTQWFDLFGRLRQLPAADRPTLYTIQSVYIAAVYAVGLGKLSKALSLLSEAVTLSIDAGLHRSVEAYDYFDPVEDEVRKRTFWCIYMWDKQASAHFGRPCMIRLRDCDVGEPAIIDDEFISRDGIGAQPRESESRMSAFVSTIRLFIVLEAVLDTPPTRRFRDSSRSFLDRATSTLSGSKRNWELREEESLLDEVCRSIPEHWRHCPETIASDDVVRITQAERLYCAEQFVRLLIYRHRFSELVAERTFEGVEGGQSTAEREAIVSAHACSLKIVAAHLNIATKGLMTYYGVHVIHQLTQAGRTLVAILLICQSESTIQHLVPDALHALRSCVGLLRRFSGRYVCGMRSSDMMAEFCRLTQIPLDTASLLEDSRRSRPPWIRPVRKKTPSHVRTSVGSHDSPSSQQASTPEQYTASDIFGDMTPSSAVSPSSMSSFSFGPGASSPAFSPDSAATPNANGVAQQYPFASLPTSPAMYGAASGASVDPAAALQMSTSDFLAFLSGTELDVGGGLTGGGGLGTGGGTGLGSQSMFGSADASGSIYPDVEALARELLSSSPQASSNGI